MAVPSWSDKFQKAKGFEPATINYRSAIVGSSMFSAEQLNAPQAAVQVSAQPGMCTAAVVGTALAIGAAAVMDKVFK